MKFKRYYIAEGFSNFYYKLPKDKSEQLFDFYMLVTLKQPFDENLKQAWKEAIETLLISLKKELLESVLFAISAEFRHIFSNNSPKDVKKFFDKYGAKNFIKDYAVKYKLKSSHNFNEYGEREKRDLSRKFKNNNRGYIESYEALRYAMKKNNINLKKFIEMSSDAFENMEWNQSYGGKPWSDISEGWLRLYNAQSEGDLIVAIDHVYDLQHNTDTVFNKLNSYYKGGYGWIKKALDKKKEIRNAYEIYNDISGQLRSFVPAVIKDTTNLTLEKWLKDNKKTTNLKKDVLTKSSKKEKYKLDDSYIWENGTWENGTWHNGTWKTGIWENGTWEKGTWEYGTWKIGTWEDGFWKNGTWENGTWRKGTWEDGTWEHGTWEDGTWKNGTWEHGTWKDGFWKNGTWRKGTWKNGTWEHGTWKDGFWKNGTWEDGIWRKGTWENGTWEQGSIFNPITDKYESSIVNPNIFYKNLGL